jgi:hypothetical protein
LHLSWQQSITKISPKNKNPLKAEIRVPQKSTEEKRAHLLDDISGLFRLLLSNLLHLNSGCEFTTERQMSLQKTELKTAQNGVAPFALTMEMSSRMMPN